jgi:hypothetical protein
VYNNTKSLKYIDMIFGPMGQSSWNHQARNTPAAAHWSMTKHPPLVPGKVCVDARYPATFSTPTVEACIKI